MDKKLYMHPSEASPEHKGLSTKDLRSGNKLKGRKHYQDYLGRSKPKGSSIKKALEKAKK